MHPTIIAVLLGAAGGLVLELVELGRFLKKYGHLPFSRRGRPKVVRVDGVLRRFETPFVYLLAIAIRAVVGGCVAGGLALAGPLNAWAALVAGVGAYSVVDRWADGTDVRVGVGAGASEIGASGPAIRADEANTTKSQAQQEVRS